MTHLFHLTAPALCGSEKGPYTDDPANCNCLECLRAEIGRVSGSWRNTYQRANETWAVWQEAAITLAHRIDDFIKHEHDDDDPGRDGECCQNVFDDMAEAAHEMLSLRVPVPHPQTIPAKIAASVVGMAGLVDPSLKRGNS